MRKLTIQTFMMLWLVSAIPHLTRAQIGELTIRRITPNEGLTQGVVTGIFTDSRGFVWMTGLDGINRFDGIRCQANGQIAGGETNFGTTRTVLEDNRGNIWVGTTDGIIQYNYPDNKFTRHPLALAGGLRNQTFGVYSYDKAGNLLIGTSVGQMIIYNHRTRDLLQFPIPAPAGATELGCFSFYHGESLYNDVHLVYHVGNTTIQVYTLTHINGRKPVWKLSTIPFRQAVTPMAFMRSPGTLFFSSGGHLYKSDLATGVISQSPDALFEGTDFLNYSMDGHGRLWISSAKGIMVADTGSLRSFRFFPNNPDGVSGKYKHVTIDRNNIAWITIWGEGVEYAPLYEPKFTSFLTAQEAEKARISNFVRAIEEGLDGNFYCATQSGVIVLDRELRFMRRLPGIPSTVQLPDLKIAGQTLLVASDRENPGLYVHDLPTGKTRRLDIFPPYGSDWIMDVYHVNPLGEQTCLLSTLSSGFFSVNIRSGKATPVAESAVAGGMGNPVYSYTSPRGHLYACFNLMGFVVYPGSSEKKFFPFLPGSTVKHIIPAGGENLWIATTEGLLLFDDARMRVLKKYTMGDGLPNNVVYALIPDARNNLWLSTNKGLAYLDRTTDKFYWFTKEDGLQDNEFNSHAVIRARDGRIIFGGVNGLSVVNEQIVGHRPPTPVLQLTAIQTDSVLNPFAVHDQAVVLAPGSRFFEAEWTAINYSNPLLCKIRYKLSSVDPDWQLSGNPATIRYAGLSPGKYELQVMASNTRGDFAGPIRKLTIIVRPHWWQSTVFRVGMGMILAFFGWVLIREYVRRRMEKEKQRLEQQLLIQQERERIVADLHDDIGATLSSMRIYSELASRVWEDKPGEGRRFVEKVSATSRDLMERMSDIVWSMKSPTADTYTLEARLKNYCSEFLSPRNIACTFSIDPVLSVAEAHPEARKSLLLIAKEAINNMAKYSGASAGTISLRKENDLANLIISDNGCGFDPQGPVAGNGLNNIVTRSRQLGGDCEILSATGQGTTVICRFPLAIFSHTG